jgi:hypothetical protein
MPVSNVGGVSIHIKYVPKSLFCPLWQLTAGNRRLAITVMMTVSKATFTRVHEMFLFL